MFARMKALEPGLFEDAVRCGCDSVVGWRCVDSKGHSLANWNWKKMSLPEHQDTTLSKNKLIQAVPLGICGTSGGIAFNVAAGQILSWHLPRFAQGSNLQHGQGKASLTLETIHQQFSLGFWYMHIRIYSICASATILKVAKCLASIAPHATCNLKSMLWCILYPLPFRIGATFWSAFIGPKKKASSVRSQRAALPDRPDWWDQAFSFDSRSSNLQDPSSLQIFLSLFVLSWFWPVSHLFLTCFWPVCRLLVNCCDDLLLISPFTVQEETLVPAVYHTQRLDTVGDPR